ncbi:MAG TPA: efflux RND transporter periplasmic adaptor subunit [Phycisphaerales bacterium]|nr:efflux RND transporter periplasmic adaptor subunit [Phycisphaerales bacterium]
MTHGDVRFARIALSAAACLMIVGGALIPAFAHDPHEAATAAPAVDSDGPRRISDQTAALIGLRTAEVDFGRIESVVHLNGFVRAMPDRTHLITSSVAGILARIDARVGQRVRQGQSLGAVQSADLARMVTDLHKAEIEYEHTGVELAQTNANIAQLTNQLHSTELQAASLEAEYERARSGGDAVGANILSNRRTSAIQSRAQVDTLKISLSTAEHTVTALGKIQESTLKTIDSMRDAINIIHANPAGSATEKDASKEETSGGTFILRSPIDGIITRRDGLPGQGLEPGKPILTIVDDSEMLIEAELPESMIPSFASALTAANPIEVRIRRAGDPAADEPIATGHIIGISPTVDPIRRTARLLISATNTISPSEDSTERNLPANPAAPIRIAVPTALQEGMFVSLDVARSSATASTASSMVVIPISAVLTDGPIPFVFTKEKDAYLKRPIITGIHDDRLIEVKDGLVPGDIVVSQGAYLLSQIRPSVPENTQQAH